jgi:hypothetical protein
MKFLLFINGDKTNIRNENWIEKRELNAINVTVNVTVNNTLKLDICSKKAPQGRI